MSPHDLLAVAAALEDWEIHVGQIRYYGSGVEKALFMLSRGTCYEPTCKTAVLRMTKSGTPRVNVQIAHIYPLGENEARYDSTVPKLMLNKFDNLILLCQTHHTEVDSELWLEFYPTEELQKWKRSREGGLSNALSELPPLLSDDQFQDLMVNAIARMRDEIITAIDKVAGISQETLTLLKSLVSESFTRPYLSEEAVASLEYSARVFADMGDQTVMLYESAKGLNGIQDHAWMLHESSRDLRGIPDYVIPLLKAAHDLKTILPDHVGPLGEAARKLQGLPDYVELLSIATRQLEAARLPEVFDRLSQVEDTARRLGAATSNAADFGAAARAMEGASQNIGIAMQVTGPRGEWSWSSFRWGAGACFVAVVALLALWTFAIR